MAISSKALDNTNSMRSTKECPTTSPKDVGEINSEME